MEKIAISMPEDLKEKMNRQADKENRNFSSMARHTMIKYLENCEEGYYD